MSAVAAREALGPQRAIGSRGDTATASTGVPLRPTTAPGEHLVAILDELVPVLAERAPVHDRDGSFPFSSLADLQAAGVCGARAGRARWPRRDPASRPRRRRRDTREGRRVARHRRQHARRARARARADARTPGRARSRGAGGRRRPPRRRRREDDHGGGDQRARPGAGAAVHAGDGHAGRRWLVEGGKIFCTLSPAATVLQTAVCMSRTAARNGMPTFRSRSTSLAWSSTTTGMRSACARPAATR